MRSLFRVIVKEFQQLRRDKRMIPAMIVGPIVQLLALGFAANNDVTDIPMLLLDDDRGAASRALVDRFTASGYFRLVGSVDAESEIEPQLVRGHAQVALSIPLGFEGDVAACRSPRVQLIVDGSDSTSAVVVGLFRVPLRGSLALLVLLTVPFLFCTLGLGLFVSTIVRTQQQAMMSAVYLVMVPMIYLSGLIFPVENMPAVIQKFTVVIPLKYYTHIIRGIFLKGSGLEVLWPDAAALLVIGATVFVLAALRFRKSLD